MDCSRQLRWVQQNRSWKWQPAQAGDVARRWCEARWNRAAGVHSELCRMLEQIEDPQFHRECELLGLDGGVLRIGVRRPEALHAMRLRWHMALREVFKAQARRAQVHRIEFVCSRESTRQ